jgi:hypothetical protein
MPTALDQAAQATPPTHMIWVNPPAEVTRAISALQHQCEAWPKTPTSNPLAIVSGFEDAVCHAVTGHGLFVPEDLANSIMQIGTFAVVAVMFVLFGAVGVVAVVFRLWSTFFGPPRPPKPAKPPPDVLTSVVVVIGWLGWLSAAAMSAPVWSELSTVFLAAALMWTLIVPHLVSLLRNKGA